MARGPAVGEETPARREGLAGPSSPAPRAMMVGSRSLVDLARNNGAHTTDNQCIPA